ncbi:adenosine deaminase [Actinospica acidithermotolerans]|uniref:adenosine deaminase n=1 Tax=Actinospica acidithermotolerans TaxID=2828514 RepID=UPI002011CD40|nr:adenosine deaminase [Actinospica acidithermotolerans]
MTDEIVPAPIALTEDVLRRVPKVALHDHLDGGLRPATVIELAHAAGYTGLPTTDAAELGTWFRDAADSGSLERYLETFDHTIAVMQSADALRRVAAEAVEDLAADGVVYAELRYAPEQHLRGGLTLDQVVEAVNEGCREGEDRGIAAGNPIQVGTLVTAMRQNTEPGHSLKIAELAVRHRDSGVAGFDIAGPELGFGPELHADAFNYLREQFLRFTIHAGEADGPTSIAKAVQLGTQRLGHGVRVIEDITFDEDGEARLGRLAAFVRDTRIALEVCPSSNLQTGIAGKIAEHPVQKLYELGFTITISCDNRLMSGTSTSRELGLLVDAFNWDLSDLELVALNGIEAGFLSQDRRDELSDLIIDRFQDLRD